MNSRPQQSSSPARVPLPLALRVASFAAVLQAVMFAVVAGVLLWGGFQFGPLWDVVALGGFFLVLAALVVGGALGMRRGSALARGVLITVQVLLALSLVTLWGQLAVPIIVVGLALVAVIVAGSIAATSRAYIGR